MTTSLYYRHWGKARLDSDETEGPAYHLLPYHCLDVTSLTEKWLENKEYTHGPAGLYWFYPYLAQRNKAFRPYRKMLFNAGFQNRRQYLPIMRYL